MKTRRVREPGFTLIEVCISALVLAIGATALFAVSLSTRRTIAVSPKREQMHQYARLLSETLKGYVTTCPPGSCATNPPGTLGAPNGSWALSKPNGQDCETDGAAWALSDGTHDAKCFLPPPLADPLPAGAAANLEYIVASAGPKKITINMSWQEPD